MDETQLHTQHQSTACMWQAHAQHGSKWSLLERLVGTRTQVQCRERWVNCLGPGLEKGFWSPAEDARLREAHASVQRLVAHEEEGTQLGDVPGVKGLKKFTWSAVAEAMNGLGSTRTDNQCLRRWTHLHECATADSWLVLASAPCAQQSLSLSCVQSRRPTAQVRLDQLACSSARCSYCGPMQVLHPCGLDATLWPFNRQLQLSGVTISLPRHG